MLTRKKTALFHVLFLVAMVVILISTAATPNDFTIPTIAGLILLIIGTIGMIWQEGKK